MPNHYNYRFGGGMRPHSPEHHHGHHHDRDFDRDRDRDHGHDRDHDRDRDRFGFPPSLLPFILKADKK